MSVSSNSWLSNPPRIIGVCRMVSYVSGIVSSTISELRVLYNLAKPVHGDTQTDELIFTPTYYYIGHFSKFVRQGARRVSTAASRSTLESTTWENPSGERVTVVMNRTDEPMDYALIVGDQQVKASILPHAMQTLVY